MNRQEKISFYAQYLPSLTQLQDAAVAEDICDVWQDLLDLSPFDSVEQARFKEGYDDVSLISHVNSTVACALAVSEIIQQHHGIDFDRQRIIAFGLLHDVDKIIDYVYDENGALVKSDYASKIQHGVMSAIYANKHHFDMDMIHMILTHTTDSKLRPQIKEAILFNYIDLCDWDLTCRYTAHR